MSFHSRFFASLRSARGLIAMGFAILFPTLVFATENSTDEASPRVATLFLWMAIILLAAKLASLVEKLGQPAVLGEIVMGVILGNLALVGINAFETIKQNEMIHFLAELGVVILLFQIGLESNLRQMRSVGMRAFLVAIVGVVVPFVLGTYVVGPLILPGLSSNAYLFLGAALTATSVGITARVFKDLGKLQLPEAQIVLGAAVIDDVLGLIILAVVSAIATVGAVSLGGISLIVGKAILFLVGAILLGQFLAPWLGRAFSKIHTGIGMKFTLAISFGLVFAYLADLTGLAAIVGAFAAGLVLDAVHFKHFKDPQIIEDVKKKIQHAEPNIKIGVLATIDHHAQRHVEDFVEQVGYLFVPLFFIVTGMSVNLRTFANPSVVGVALAISVVAVLGKYVAGSVAGNVNKHIVGVGMIPRGEVGLIFASIGKSLGVVSDEIFSVIVIMVIVTTLVTPPILAWLLKRSTTAAT